MQSDRLERENDDDIEQRYTDKQLVDSINNYFEEYRNAKTKSKHP